MWVHSFCNISLGGLEISLGGASKISATVDIYSCRYTLVCIAHLFVLIITLIIPLEGDFGLFSGLRCPDRDLAILRAP
jgi:hypothetical protein